jgi:hypothetical protein
MRLHFPYFPLIHGTIEQSILTHMRRLLTFAVLAVALVLPAGSAAQREGTNDGTLSVKDARGTIIIAARGGVIGSFASGSLRIVDPVEGDGTGPVVTGQESHKPLDEKTDVYRGTKVRFRLIGGFFRVRIQGRGVNLSLVGKGTVTLNGAGTDDDGTYSVNGGAYGTVPDFSFVFPLSASSAPTQ